ncbi:MAG TPA: ABC-2 transporter permease [Candidatus Nanopelagicaceae bacterium]|nr:ABC-2 transporter permease [Candidatus Nanopelagicaceae bacterium]
MSLKILFVDELKGFYKSKVMIVLWVGLPLLSLLFHYITPNTEGFPISSIVAIILSSVGGTLASAMLSTSIASEKMRHVYDLYLIRPVKRANILLAKYFSVYLCLIIATGISLTLGLILDQIFIGNLPEYVLNQTIESLTISMAAMAISCSIGVFFGITVSSVPVATILSVYIGNQISAISILPTVFLDFIDPVIFSLLIGPIAAVIMLTVSSILFSRKQF